ncbi:Putative F-box/FBD/LRR-repeat protein At5g44950 [Linum perenne]
MAATTNEQIKSTTTNNDEGRDCISELPDEIIHQILRRMSFPENDRTAVLSRRWRSVWSCYPDVQYFFLDLEDSPLENQLENFRKFVQATTERFSRHNQMRMETLEICVAGESADYSSLVKQLLILATERKVENIYLSSHIEGPPRELPWVTGEGICTEANSGAKILRLCGIEELDVVDYFLPFLPCMQNLRLSNISARILTSLIARCPLLQTLHISFHSKNYPKKIQISSIPNLKTLKIGTSKIQELEIEAAGLQNLDLCGQFFQLQKMSFSLSLRAPQVKHLEITYYVLEVDLFNAVISELPSLKTLTLRGFKVVRNKLKLSIPKLEVFKLLDLPSELEEIELDAGPTLSGFFLQSYSPGGLRKCTVNNASACQFEANFTIKQRKFAISEERQRSYLGFVKSFISRFPQFQTVYICYLDDEHNVTYNEEETGDNTSNPMSIDHLKYCTVLSNSKVDKQALLEALFRVCRPNHLTLIHRHKNSERFFEGLLSIMQQKGGADESLMWLNGLKDAKIITQDVDVEIEKEEELLMGYSTCKTKNQLSLELTWGL